jgi:transposase
LAKDTPPCSRGGAWLSCGPCLSPSHTACRRDETLELRRLDTQIAQLEHRLAEAAHADAQTSRLMTHPGVGPLTALATVLVLGPVARFPSSNHVVSYVGLAPAIASSAGKHHVGRITKQGNPMLRHLLGQAAQSAVRRDAALKHLYLRVLHRRGRARAKVAAARALLVRLYIMQRDAIDYDEFRRRGAARAA